MLSILSYQRSAIRLCQGWYNEIYAEHPRGDHHRVSRPHNSVAVYRGPLPYALAIQHSQKVLSQNVNESLAVDLEFNATAPWEYTPSTHPPSSFTRNRPQTENSPRFGPSPYTIIATACPPARSPINWALAGDTFTISRLRSENPAYTGAPMNITLSPYGATKLRISEFPTFKVGA